MDQGPSSQEDFSPQNLVQAYRFVSRVAEVKLREELTWKNAVLQTLVELTRPCPARERVKNSQTYFCFMYLRHETYNILLGFSRATLMWMPIAITESNQL